MKNNTNLIIVGVVVLILVGGGFYIMSTNKYNTNTTSGTDVMEKKPVETSTDAAMEEKKEETGAMMEDPNAKKFVVSGNNFSFDVKEMNVKKGDTVTVTFKNVEGFHDWVVDEFNAKTKQIKANEEETITFVADKVGTFEYYCSVGQHRANGMVGNLIVAE